MNIVIIKRKKRRGETLTICTARQMSVVFLENHTCVPAELHSKKRTSSSSRVISLKNEESDVVIYQTTPDLTDMPETGSVSRCSFLHCNGQAE